MCVCDYIIKSFNYFNCFLCEQFEIFSSHFIKCRSVSYSKPVQFQSSTLLFSIVCRTEAIYFTLILISIRVQTISCMRNELFEWPQFVCPISSFHTINEILLSKWEHSLANFPINAKSQWFGERMCEPLISDSNWFVTSVSMNNKLN